MLKTSIDFTEFAGEHCRCNPAFYILYFTIGKFYLLFIITFRLI